MREILFRGKTVCDGDWIYGGITWNPSKKKVFIHTEWDEGEVIPETVGQYTGMTDKNGTKIFEHDIVRIAVCGTYDNYVVSYDKENARFVVGDTGFTFWSYISTKIEVIGNIHDSPELLNK